MDLRARASLHAGHRGPARTTSSTPARSPWLQTNRGGRSAFHGPGQVVAYPLIDLRRAGYFVKEYVYRLEEAVLRTLSHFGVTGHRVAGAPGIYVRLDDPFSHAALTGPRPEHDPFRGLGKIKRAGHQGQPPRHLPRRGALRRHGPRTLLADQPLRPRRAANGRPFYNRRSNPHEEEAAAVLGRKLGTFGALTRTPIEHHRSRPRRPERRKPTTRWPSEGRGQALAHPRQG